MRGAMPAVADQFPKTAAMIESGRLQKLHLGAQLYVSRDGNPLIDAAFGESRPGIPLTPDSMPLWLSAGKPFAAVAVARFWESGQLDFDDPVVRFIPEFAARGKQAVTIRQLLTHTAGLRWVEWSPSWQQMIDRICNAPLEPRWIPGQTAGYHPFTTWYILGEMIRRLDPAHRAYEDFIADEIFRPLHMIDCFFAMSPEQFHTYAARIAPLEPTHQSTARPAFFDTEAGCSICSPGASGRGPARQLGRFYEMLLAQGHPLLQPNTVKTLTSRHRIGMQDLTFKKFIDWGLGFIINSAHYDPDVPYGFGPHASPGAFGHGGSQSSVAMADPEYGLAAVVIFNGMPGEPAHQRRMGATLGAIYEDLGLEMKNLKPE
jgi:CubicO group peptidase (beta-lactamase class C family)